MRGKVMADYIVTTDFRAKDMVSPQLRHMEAQTKRFAKTTQTSLGQIFKGSFLGVMGANLVTSGLARVRAGVGGVIDDYMELDQMLNAAAVKFGGIDYGSKEFKELGAIAREVGRTTKFQSQDAASGLEALAAGGFKSVEAMKLLPSAANFAAAAKMNLAQGTEVAVAALRAFAMASEDAEIQARNLNKISDVLAATDAATAATMEGLSETVAWAASRFTAAGQSVETFGAIAGGLANVKVVGSMAGTVMRRLVAELTDIGPKGKKAFHQLGMSIKGDIVDEQGNLNNLIDIFAKMEAPLKRMGTAKRSKIIQDIFGERGAAVIALINNGVASVKQLEAELQAAGGTSKRMGDQLNQSLTFRIMALQNALQEKGFQVFEKFLVDGRGGIEEMIKAINKWDVSGIAEGLRDIGSGVKWLIDHRGEIVRLGIAFGTIKAALALRGFAAGLPGAFGALAGGGAGLRTPLGAILAGAAPSIAMPMLGAGAGAGAIAPSPAMPIYTGRYDNWGKGPIDIKQASKITMSGIANVAFAAGTAGIIGYQIGDAIRSAYIDPAIEKSFKMREELDTKLLNLAHQIATGKIGEAEGRKGIEESKRMLEESTSFWSLFSGFGAQLFGGAESPMKDFFRQAQEIRKAETAVSTKIRMPEMTSMYPMEPWEIDDAVKGYRSHLEKNLADLEKAHDKENMKYRSGWAMSGDALYNHGVKIKEIDTQYDSYLKTLEKLNELTLEQTKAGGVANVKIEISGEGASRVTTTTKTSGPRAPNVDVSQAGAN